MIKVVVFDFDGVIVDSVKFNIEYANMLLRRFGRPLLTKAQEKDAYTITTKEFYKKYFSGVGYIKFKLYSVALRLKLIRRFRLSRHLKKLLKWLDSERYKIAIVTNRTHETYRILDYLDIHEYFDYILTADDLKYPKPSPYGLNKVVEHFKVKKNEVLYIGDTEFDSKAAKWAGIVSIIYKNKKYGDYHIRDLWSIKRLLRKMG